MVNTPKRRRTDTVWGWISNKLPAYIALVATALLIMGHYSNRSRGVENRRLINNVRDNEQLACIRSNRSDRVLQRIMEQSYEVNVRPEIYKLNAAEIGQDEATRILRIYPRDIMILRRKPCVPGEGTLANREKVRLQTVLRIRKIERENGPPYPGYKLTPLNFNAEVLIVNQERRR